jgi:hypothetical protein
MYFHKAKRFDLPRTASKCLFLKRNTRDLWHFKPLAGPESVFPMATRSGK